MASLTHPCPDCSCLGDAAIQQHAGGRLVWGFGFRCTGCGKAVEYDDYGLPPQKFRLTVFEQEGIWGLRISAPELWGSPSVLMRVRATRQLSLAATAQLKAQAGSVVMRGSHEEMLWLAQHLELSEVQCVVSQLEAAQASAIPDLGEWWPKSYP